MARRVEYVTIPEEGRDRGKKFVLTEMAASRAEAWAARLLLAIGRSGVDIPAAAVQPGMAGVASITMHAFFAAHWLELEPLAQEMMNCVQIMPDPNREETTRTLIETDIEEVLTRVFLRERVLSLHLGFSVADRYPTFGHSLSAISPSQPSAATPTSPQPSPPASLAA